MLTRKQKELLLFIRATLAQEGVTPSFDEMRQALGLRSKSGIHRLITGLEERGFIKRLPHRARALEILKFPAEEIVEKAAATTKSLVAALHDSLTLPFYGRIAAGTPIEAISAPQGDVLVPTALLLSAKGNCTGEHYVLEISGDSMIDAGILNGDKVVIRRTDTAENGAIVVALVDNGEATLKYLERRKDALALLPANKDHKPQIFPKDRVKVQGQLVGLLRRY